MLGELVDTPPEIGRVEDFPISVGEDRISARVYTPLGSEPFPLHLYYHGGAFICGSAFDASTDVSMRERCASTGCVVVNVEYRLAPEYRFPIGVEDAYAGLLWAVQNADLIGIDPTRVSVGGASSGGNFAAAVSVMTRDRGGPQLVLQIPEIAGTDITKSSYFWRHPGLGHDVTREEDLALIDFYVRTPSDKAHPYASPLMTPDLSGVAPAYVMSAEFDPRRDECEAYVARLQDAGVEAVARTMVGHVHGSCMLTATWAPARQWQAEANAAIRRANSASTGRLFDDFDPVALPK
jgi:acetyl esterase